MAAPKRTSKGSVDPIKLPNSLIKGVRTATPASGKDADSSISNTLTSAFNRSITDLRTLEDKEALRLLARAYGDVSTAVWSTLSLANTPLKVLAYDSQHQISFDGTMLTKTILTRMNYTSDYTKGFDDRPSLEGIKNSLLRDILLAGACGGELVLDEQRLPNQFRVTSTKTLKFKTGTKRSGTSYNIVPAQKVGSDEVILSFPTFFYEALDQDPESAYAFSPLEPALNSAPQYTELLEDVRRVVRRSGHSRLVVKLITEQIIKSAPPEYKGDPDKMQTWMTTLRDQIKEELENLSPETALVLFDTLEADYLNSQIGGQSEYGPLVETFDGVQSTALKTPPSVLGKRMGGSQNVSSTESLLFIKTASRIQPPVAAVLSRAMTLAVRLYGFDGYVMVSFDPIDLRPEHELEAFKQMKQQRVLELLSLGFLTDDEAAEELRTGMRAPGAPKLSGTFFYQNQGLGAPPNPNGDPAKRALTGDSPKSSGGRDNAQR
jgi:hypothetical protein